MRSTLACSVAALVSLTACRAPRERERAPRPEVTAPPAQSQSNADSATAAVADVAAPEDAPRVVTFDDVPLPDGGSLAADASLGASPTGTTLDLPTSDAWPAINRWNDAM